MKSPDGMKIIAGALRSPDDVVGELYEAARLELAGRLKVFAVAAEPVLILPVPEHGRDRRREVERVSGRDDYEAVTVAHVWLRDAAVFGAEDVER